MCGSGGTPQLVSSIRSRSRATHDAAGVGVVTPGDASFPTALLADHDGPAVLFHLGDPSRVADLTVSIVGTRRSTGYGEGVAFELGERLSSAWCLGGVGAGARHRRRGTRRGRLGRGGCAGRRRRERPRRHLSTPQPGVVASGGTPRLHLVRVAARRTAGAMAVPVTQSHHRRARHPSSWWSRAGGRAARCTRCGRPTTADGR